MNVFTTVVKREWEVDESLLSPALLAGVVLLDDVVDLRNGSGHQERHDKGEDKPVSAHEENEDAVEDSEDDESPSDTIHNNLFTASGELVDHSAEQKEVNQGPHVKGLGSVYGLGECIVKG